MPQLDPAPWLLILVFSWLVFLTILPSKVMAHIFPNGLTLQSMKKTKTNPWIWPWH
uniref:ATP synthase complex subunit 8 n=1 Tax=Lophiodes caulinaris TaxID=314249 RepID=D3KR72_LOPCA|nr:ATP synthase F0 subunit 8 [Lophiodes caulinaris]BAI76959.1 ATPase subunit 8 [Lophiodes caulinaris]